MLAALALLLGVTPEQSLESARTALEAYDYGAAAKHLEGARARIDELSEELRFQTWRTSAVVALSLGEEAEAQSYLVEVLLMVPTFTPPEDAWPPSWRAVLERARNNLPDRDDPEVSIAVPKEVVAGQPFDVRALVRDPSGIASVDMYVGGRALPMVEGEDSIYVAAVPGELVRPPDVRLWIEVFDRAGNGPGPYERSRPSTRVAVRSPIVAAPPVEAPPSVLERWWFWAIAGAVVATTAVAFVATRPDDSGRVLANIEFP
ncbi:MAG: hypothetical protein RIT81_41065 [Deltaproteobacteria bacterium]